jgi:DNA repair protein RecN (Recombination protein N)
VLAELLGEAIEVSSQHASQALLRPELQSRLLDGYAGCLALRSAVEAGVAWLREREQEALRLRAESEERTRRSDYLGFQLRELDEARLDVAEAAAALAEQRRLAHAEQLSSQTRAAAALLSGDPEQPDAAGAPTDSAAGARAGVRAFASLRLAIASASPPQHTELADLAARASGARHLRRLDRGSPSSTRLRELEH